MTGNAPELINASSILDAWVSAMEFVHRRPAKAAPPLLLTIRGGANTLPCDESRSVAAVDHFLAAKKVPSTGQSALTIFPYRQWERLGKPNVREFSGRCVERLYPRMRARNALNRYGTYFQRLMDYPAPANAKTEVRNQLAYVIDQLSKPRRMRESALQMSILHPAMDHTEQTRRGFPCLQQVGVSHLAEGIAVNAFYPTQYIDRRGLGNYMGLTHLGIFIAHQSDRHFSQLNVYVGSPSLGARKKDIPPVLDAVRAARLADRRESADG